MAKQTLNTLKNWFRTSLKPTQAQFWDWMDSYFHKDDKIPLTSLDGLQEELDKKRSTETPININEVSGLQNALHSHANKSTLDKITEADGLPIWNGGAWPGGGGTGGAGIDDEITAPDSTWSSEKIAEELSGKEAAGTSELAITQLVDGATDNTLKKLQDKIVAINAIIGGSTADGDNLVNTVAELLAVFSTFPEGSDMVTLLTAKLNTTDVYNALDRVLEGKALDARQGKVLKDLIDQLRLDLNNINPAKELVISKSTFNSIAEPGIYKNGSTAKQIIGHRLSTNATDFSITVAGVTYTKTATYPITLAANAELIINDVTIQTGYNIGNVILIIQ